MLSHNQLKVIGLCSIDRRQRFIMYSIKVRIRIAPGLPITAGRVRVDLFDIYQRSSKIGVL